MKNKDKSNKQKPKINMNMSERDKMLIWIIASVLILFAGYYFGFSRLSEEADKYEQELTQANAKYTDLAAKFAKKEQYITETEEYKNKYNTVLSGYQNGTSQDTSLVFLNDVEKLTGGWISSTVFTSTSSIYKFGNITSSNPSGGSGSVYSTDFEGYKTTLTLAYTATYDQFKQLISFLNNYYSRITIDTIDMAYNDQDGTVSGSMVMSSYCVTGSSRPFVYPTIESVKGTANIFKSAAFLPNVIQQNDENGNHILADYDYYMLLNSASSDLDAVIVGQKGDNGASVIRDKENKEVDAQVRFAGAAGVYSVQYTVNGKQYPAENYEAGAPFIPGPSLDFLIMSSKRTSVDDNSGVNLTIVNDTDMNLNVKISNDDTTKSRVNIVNTTGIVNVFK